MNWPPKPGELWVADGEWPTYGLSDQAGFISPGDVFLVVEVWSVIKEKLKPGSIGLKDFKSYRAAELQVIVHGVKRMIASEYVDGKPDMHPLEQPSDSNTIITEET